MKIENYKIPTVPETIPHGDMPGDVIQINNEHITKASTIFPFLVDEINKFNQDKIVISVFGIRVLKSLFKPFVLVGSMVYHKIHNKPHSPFMGF